MDAIFILVDNGSVKSAESIARDLFENVLYLKFILNEKHFRRRALSYHYSYLKDKLSFAILISSNSQKGNVTNVKNPKAKAKLKKMLDDEELTEQERHFCLYYVKYFNGT